MNSELSKLKNLGPVSINMLNEIGIFTKKDIIEAGPSKIYHILKANGKDVSMIIVYALYGAINNIHFAEIDKETKKMLINEVENTQINNLSLD